MKPWNANLPPAPPGLSKLEALRRAKALRRLDWFVQEFWEEVESFPIIWGWHIAAFCWHLMAITFGFISNLLYTAPPRSTKSRAMTIFWPSWEFARDLPNRFLTTGNDQELVIELSVECRRIMESEKYRRWFPHVEIETDQNTKKKIDLSNGGRRQITTVGTKTTGKGGNRLVADDLHDANGSKAAFKTEAKWFFKTFSTRGDPGGFAMVLGCQMLDLEDTANGILNNKELSKHWVHLNVPLHYDPKRPCTTIPLPFIEEWVAEHGEYTPWFDSREPGECFWPPVYTQARIAAAQASLSDREFDAQFQQIARNLSGGVWKEEYFQSYRVLEFEKVWRWSTSTDTPFKSKQRSKTGDPDCYAQTAFAEKRRIIEIEDPNKPGEMLREVVIDYYVLGGINKQIGYTQMKSEFIAFVKQWNAILGDAIGLNLVEDKASGSAIIEDLSPFIACIEEFDPGKISKELRFELVAPTVKALRLHFPEPGAVITRNGKVIHQIDTDFVKPMKLQFSTIPDSDDGKDDMADTFAQLDLHNRYGDNSSPGYSAPIPKTHQDVYTVQRRRTWR